MSRPFLIKYGWKDFDNSSSLTSYQKYKIIKRYKQAVKDAIQRTINESIEDHKERRAELDAHRDPEQQFRLDIGGEG